MAIATQKITGESNEKLIGRWKKKTQKARVIQSVRGKQRFSRKTSKTKIKRSAIFREHYRALRRKNQFYS